MKKLIIVSKTHLDLGFTDYADNIKNKYLEQYIPQAIDTANKLNKDGNKRFVWTTGAWILSQALHSKNQTLHDKLEKALIDGYIAPHALAFTTHTELLDRDLFEYSLSLVDEIDKLCGRKTIAAKMTDVPGHTCAILPILAKHGVKLLHIGVNGASAIPDVPECFLWRFEGSEVVVIYSGDYGGVFKSDYIDDILYFDHTLDNRGANSSESIAKKLEQLQGEYPDYEVVAGRIDDIAEQLWAVRDQLPIIENEIGDSWIHGVATDPFKTAAYRRLCALKNRWIEEKSLDRQSEEYKALADSLLCVAEHTWGMDTKTHFGDYENYLKKDFVNARMKDIVRIRRPFGYFPQTFVNFISQIFSKNKLSYSAIERSWSEQRGYIDKAIACLSIEHRREAERVITNLRPIGIEPLVGMPYTFGEILTLGKYNLSVNEKGGVTLIVDGQTVLGAKDSSLLEYRSYSSADYEYWFNHYTRDLKKTRAWAIGDFARPELDRYDSQYPSGLFDYIASDPIVHIDSQSVELQLKLADIPLIREELGAPYDVYVRYSINGQEGLRIQLIWLKKDAVRTTESIALRLYPNTDNGYEVVKLSERIDPFSVVRNGGRKLSVCEKTYFWNKGVEYSMESLEAACISFDGGNLLHYDNSPYDVANGVAYVLYNNVWGTNFPLWYDESAAFEIRVR